MSATRINGSTSVRPSANVHLRHFGNDLVLLHFGRGDYFGLDAMGAEVWALCARGLSLSEIAETLTRTFDVDYERALADVLALVEQLQQADLVTV